MNRPELVSAIQALDTDLTKTQVSSVLNALADVLAEAMSNNDKVTLPGIGVFCVKDTKERTARNPQTGALVTIPAGKRVSFKTSSRLKESVK